MELYGLELFGYNLFDIYSFYISHLSKYYIQSQLTKCSPLYKPKFVYNKQQQNRMQNSQKVNPNSQSQSSEKILKQGALNSCENNHVTQNKNGILEQTDGRSKQQKVQKNQPQQNKQPQKAGQDLIQCQKRQRTWQNKQQKPPGKKRVQFCDGSVVFTIDSEYQVDKLVGSGVYGIVASGKNIKTNQAVAIKMISKLFNNFGDTKRVLRQIKVLEFLKHKNIISLQSIMSVDDCSTFNEIYLCMQFMDFDLRRLIQSQIKITEQMIKHIMYQLLAAIHFMHSADILHRDLKPQNILMSKKCQLKLADMNLARKQTFTGNITDYVASRPYRAPQILIGSTVYTKSVDIWSIGCIFAQLLGKTIIFQGKDFIDQLKRFVAILGKPKVQFFPHIDKTSMQSLAMLIAQIPDKEKVQWKYLMPNISQKAADFLDHMLTYDANGRYTAQECLNHPYLEQYTRAPKLKCREIFDFSFDKIQLNQPALRIAIFQAANQFKQKRQKLQGNLKSIVQEQKIKKKIKEE